MTSPISYVCSTSFGKLNILIEFSIPVSIFWLRMLFSWNSTVKNLEKMSAFRFRNCELLLLLSLFSKVTDPLRKRNRVGFSFDNYGSIPSFNCEVGEGGFILCMWCSFEFPFCFFSFSFFITPCVFLDELLWCKSFSLNAFMEVNELGVSSYILIFQRVCGFITILYEVFL